MPNGNAINLDAPSAHNVYLQIAAEIGLVGLAISLLMLFFYFYRTWKLWHLLKGTPAFVTLVAITAVFTATFLRSFFEIELALQPGRFFSNLLFLLTIAFQDQLSQRAARDYGR